MDNKDERLKFGRGIKVEEAHRRCCLNKGFAKMGADGSTINICTSVLLLFGQTSFNLAFCSYLYHQYLNLPASRQVGQRFRAEDFQIPNNT
jgi:hypothetical protein